MTIAQFLQGYRNTVKSPLVTAGLVGLGTWGASKLGYDLLLDAARSLGRPLGLVKDRKTGKGVIQGHQYQKALQQAKQDDEWRKWIPRGLGLITAALTWGLHYNPSLKYNGLLTYNADVVPYKDQKNTSVTPQPAQATPQPTGQATAPMSKTFSYKGLTKQAFEWFSSPVQDINFNMPVDAKQAVQLFTNDPYLVNKPYVQNMGTAIVMDAALREGTSKPTLGGIFDSAVQKIQNKLTFGGVASGLLKTTIANQQAKLLSSAIGTVTGLSPQAQQTLISLGTWAGAIDAILG